MLHSEGVSYKAKRAGRAVAAHTFSPSTVEAGMQVSELNASLVCRENFRTVRATQGCIVRYCSRN